MKKYLILTPVGLAMGIWGLPIVVFVLFVDVFAIALTGVVNIGCSNDLSSGIGNNKKYATISSLNIMK